MTRTIEVPTLVGRVVTVMAAVLAAVVLIILFTGSGGYTLNIQLADADGLETGSQVLLGGVPVGSVQSLDLSRRNVVIAKLALNSKQVTITKGTTTSIVAANLLGEEYVSLQPGKSGVRLASGSTLAESATTAPTDLDQIVDVLDDQTRGRLAVLLQEAGEAVAGRQSDLQDILAQMPLSITAADRLLNGLVTDNHSLADLVANSDHFITQVNAKGPALKRVLGSAAGAVTTFAQQAGSLARAVQGAPQFLSTVRTNFNQAETTFAKLTPIAGELAQSTGPLDQVLRDVKPFADKAIPTLDTAASVAPQLTRLGRQGAPILSQSVNTVANLSSLAKLAQPLSAWLGLSAQDLWNIPSGWTHAIQYRDGISHIFNGALYLSPYLVLNLADTGATAAQKRQNLIDLLSPAMVKLMGLTSQRAAAIAEPGAHSSSAASSGASGSRSPTSVGSAGGGTGSGSSGSASSPTATSPVSGLLNGLGSGLAGAINEIGGNGSHKGSGASTQTTASSTTSASALSSLLGYLTGK